ncbi:MAG: ribonuclease E/G, partial [Henriciella sp.]
VKQWKSKTPLFVSENVEDQLDSIFSPVVQMKSGGYLVINQTEALVAIDVNSGKSTRERNIEQTALRTNLEAAEEACRQMRLRDLAGLVVIDFIDMEENKNNRAVEKKLKECLKIDRARVQCGKISQFGLMEISRQRRRAGVLQATSDPCEACNGTGRRRSVPSAALQLLRALEARAAGGGLSSITVHAPTEVALYLLNRKREAVTEIEDVAGFAISVRSSDDLMPGDFKIDAEKDPNQKSRRRSKSADRSKHIVGDEDDDQLPDEADDEEEDIVSEEEDDTSSDADASEDSSSDEDSGGSRKRRRRGRRGGRRRRRESRPIVPADGGALLDGLAISAPALLDDEPPALPDPDEANREAASQPQLAKTVALEAEKADDPNADDAEVAEGSADEKPSGEPQKKRRNRRRRSGNRQRQETEAQAEVKADAPETSEEASVPDTVADTPKTEPAKPKKADAPQKVEAAEKPEPAPEPEAPKPAEVASTVAVFNADKPVASEPVLITDEGEKEEDKPKKRGWWSRGR